MLEHLICQVLDSNRHVSLLSFFFGKPNVSSAPTNASPYATARDRTQDQMVKELKYLPLMSHYVDGMSHFCLHNMGTMLYSDISLQ
jgi:hypothetical protein